MKTLNSSTLALVRSPWPTLVRIPMEGETLLVIEYTLYDAVVYRHAYTYIICCSQFFLCTADTSWLDGKHVVFGKVVSGMDVVSAIEQVGSQSGKTRVPVVISDSGQLR